jgi:hypothetical protein
MIEQYFENSCSIFSSHCLESSNKWKVYNGKIISGHRSALVKHVQYTLKKNITIIEPYGLIQVNFKIEKPLSYENEYIEISAIEEDNIMYGKKDALEYSAIGDHKYSKSLEKGSYIFEISYKKFHVNDSLSDLETGNAVSIDSITFVNSTLGGGYYCNVCPEGTLKSKDGTSCDICQPGQEPNEYKSQCKPCSEGHFSDGIDGICRPCPIFTYSSPDKSHCILREIIHNDAYLQKYQLDNVRERHQKLLCQSSLDLCSEMFLGPLSFQNDLFFISFNNRSGIDITDFSFDDEDNYVEEGYIFMLKHNEQKDYDRSDTENLKLLFNIGSRISSVKIVPLTEEVNQQGVLINYSHGDNCPEFVGERYQTNLFLKCAANYTSASTPKLIKKERCTFNFEWESKFACRTCVKDELNSINVFLFNLIY